MTNISPEQKTITKVVLKYYIKTDKLLDLENIWIYYKSLTGEFIKIPNIIDGIINIDNIPTYIRNELQKELEEHLEAVVEHRDLGLAIGYKNWTFTTKSGNIQVTWVYYPKRSCYKY